MKNETARNKALINHASINRIMGRVQFTACLSSKGISTVTPRATCIRSAAGVTKVPSGGHAARIT